MIVMFWDWNHRPKNQFVHIWNSNLVHFLLLDNIDHKRTKPLNEKEQKEEYKWKLKNWIENWIEEEKWSEEPNGEFVIRLYNLVGCWWPGHPTFSLSNYTALGMCVFQLVNSSIVYRAKKRANWFWGETTQRLRQHIRTHSHSNQLIRKDSLINQSWSSRRNLFLI